MVELEVTHLIFSAQIDWGDWVAAYTHIFLKFNMIFFIFLNKW